jgi:MAP/microtubule affinity-regulating kinase
MQYLKGGELDDLWKSQPKRQFSERNAFHLFIQLLNAIDYCHNCKIIHRDLKFQNVMIADEPQYDEKGKLDITSVDLKVVDFGIFGSIAGIRMENINCGSLKYMAPELLQGHTQSTPKIDIWSLGLMLHGLVFGFLPFNKSDRAALEKQIISEELGYKQLKKVKSSSIKDEYRKHMNSLLRKSSDNLIDLIEQMLHKDAN